MRAPGPDPLPSPAHSGRRPILHHGVMSTCEEELSLSPSLPSVLFRVPSKVLSFLGQKRNLKVRASPFAGEATADGGGRSYSPQPGVRCRGRGRGGGGSQASLAKPLKKALIPGEGCHLLPPSHSPQSHWGSADKSEETADD